MPGSMPEHLRPGGKSVLTKGTVSHNSFNSKYGPPWESRKGNQRRFHGGGVKGSISGRPILTEVLAKGLGIQEAGGGLTGRVWSLVEGEVRGRRVS